MFGRICCAGALSAVRWALSAVGVLALVVLAMLATPLERPPELQSISRARGTVDLSHLAGDRALPGPRRHLARLPPLRRGGHADRARWRS